MSKREEEQGTLVLPAAAIPALRKALVQAVNGQRERVHAAAAAAFEYLNQPEPPAMAGMVGKRTRLLAIKRALKSQPSWRAREQACNLVYAAFEALDGRLESEHDWKASWNPRPRNRWDNQTRHDAATLLIPYTPDNTPPVFGAPKKKNLPPLPMGTTAFHDDTASLTIEPATRKVIWYVDRSSNAVESAWKSVLGKAFSEALEKIEWTRGMGGAFRYSDEYSEDAAMEHGGNPVFISRHFGTLGDRAYEDQHGYNPTTRKMVRRP